jgi:hypothetical protein
LPDESGLRFPDSRRSGKKFQLPLKLPVPNAGMRPILLKNSLGVAYELSRVKTDLIGSSTIDDRLLVKGSTTP